MQEFIEFQSRLENSLQKMIADREMIRLEFLKEDSVSRAVSWLQELEITNLKYDGKPRLSQPCGLSTHSVRL